MADDEEIWGEQPEIRTRDGCIILLVIAIAEIVNFFARLWKRKE